MLSKAPECVLALENPRSQFKHRLLTRHSDLMFQVTSLVLTNFILEVQNLTQSRLANVKRIYLVVFVSHTHNLMTSSVTYVQCDQILEQKIAQMFAKVTQKVAHQCFS